MTDTFSKIIGHQRSIHRLRTIIKKNTFPHAVLFYGPRHLGKNALALALASALLSTDSLGTHPDFRLVQRGRDEKTDKLKKKISIGEVRGLREHIQMSSFLGGRKVAIIDDAELLSEEASNGLLKTLEEPSPGTAIILISHDINKLLPTVRSRMAQFSFSRVSDELIGSVLESGGVTGSAAEQMVRYAAGRPGTALSLLKDSDMLNWYQEQEQLWRALQSEPLHKRFSLLSKLVPPRSDREETVNNLRDLITFWEILLQWDLRQGSEQAPRLLTELGELRGGLEVNVQPKLILERFALSLERAVN